MLWNVRVKTYDAHKQEFFDMFALLIWTIHDFPSHANVSRWSTKGFLACPNCHGDTCLERFYHGKKWCYMSHHRFLELDHKWRLNRTSFNKRPERRAPPKPLTRDEVWVQLGNCDNIFGKGGKGKRKRGDMYLIYQW